MFPDQVTSKTRYPFEHADTATLLGGDEIHTRPARSMTILATIPEEGGETIVAMARYDVDKATQLADIAFVVRDEWQGRALGTLLMKRMSEIARSRGLAGFTADVLADNKPMLMIFHKCGMQVRSEMDAGIFHLTLLFDDHDGD